MRVKAVLRNVQLVIADVEVNLNGKASKQPDPVRDRLRGKSGRGADHALKNTPDGRPILMNWDNAMIMPK